MYNVLSGWPQSDFYIFFLNRTHIRFMLPFQTIIWPTHTYYIINTQTYTILYLSKFYQRYTSFVYLFVRNNIIGTTQISWCRRLVYQKLFIHLNMCFHFQNRLQKTDNILKSFWMPCSFLVFYLHDWRHYSHNFLE